MSLLNTGINKLTMGKVNPKGSLKSVYDIMKEDRNAAKSRIGEGLQRSFGESYKSLSFKKL